MKNILLSALIIAALLCLSGTAAMAQNTGDHTINIAVNAINQLSTTGSSAITWTVTAPTAGDPPADLENTTSSVFNFTTNKANRKITAGLTPVMPTGLTLSIQVPTFTVTSGSAWTSSVTSYTVVPVLASAVEIATGGKARANSVPVHYKLAATEQAEEQSSTTYTVTLTLTNQ